MPRSHPLLVQLARVWRLSGRWLPNGWLDALRQLALFAGAYYAYRLVRGFVDGQAGAGLRERARPRRRRAHARAVLRARAAGLGAQPGLDRHRRQLDVRELALRGDHHLPDLALPRAQPAPTTSCATCSWSPWASRSSATWSIRPRPPRFMPEWGFTDTVASFVGESADEQRQRALQPVRRRAEHARGVRADDRRAGVLPGPQPRDQGALGASTRSLVTFVVVVTGQPLLDRRRCSARSWPAVSAVAASEAFARARPDAWAWRARRVKVPA